MKPFDPITNQDIRNIAQPGTLTLGEVQQAYDKAKGIKQESSFVVPGIRKEYPKDDLPFSHGQLLDALYWIHGVFEASSMNMLLIYHTAEDVMVKKPLDGGSIQIGVRELEWLSGSRSTINSAAQFESDEGNIVKYRANNGVPVIVHVLKDDICISSPDVVFYQHEYFKLPNPYSRFKEVYGSE